jgi:hypothetical protein
LICAAGREASVVQLSSTLPSLTPPKISGFRFGGMTTVRCPPSLTEGNDGPSPDTSHRKKPAVAVVTERSTTDSPVERDFWFQQKSNLVTNQSDDFESN